MRALGIEKDSGLTYVGDMYERWSLINDPIIPILPFVGHFAEFHGPGGKGVHARYAFQEITFDAVSGVRRGYIWRYGDQQPGSWYLEGTNSSITRLETYTYQGFGGIVGGGIPDVVFFTFGSFSNFTVGELIHFEALADRRDLLTIRMRQQFKLIPRLKQDFLESLEEPNKSRLVVALEKVVDGFRRSPPESVVDRCRDAMTVILQIEVGDSTKDLGALVKVYDGKRNGRSVVSDLAHAISRLHARAKPAEAHRSLPPITEREAELALNAVGTVIVSLAWGSWS